MNTIKNLLSESMQQMGMIESLSVGTVILSFAVAFLCAALIYVVYRYFYKGVSYSPSFGMLLIMLTLLTNFIILCISTNLVLSLGMVGALSIVRFRAAVKEPLDVGFLFFAIAAGLTSGARLYFIAIIGTLLVDLVFILCYLLLNGTASHSVHVQEKVGKTRVTDSLTEFTTLYCPTCDLFSPPEMESPNTLLALIFSPWHAGPRRQFTQ